MSARIVDVLAKDRTRHLRNIYETVPFGLSCTVTFYSHKFEHVGSSCGASGKCCVRILAWARTVLTRLSCSFIPSKLGAIE